MSDLRLISAGDHLDLYFLPPTLWQERLPARYRDRAPRVVDGPQGRVWRAADRIWGPSGRKPAGFLEEESYRFRPGVPAERLADMDRDGVFAQVIYGHPGGFPCADRDLERALFAAYNDWALDFGRHDPDRLCVLAMLPPFDPAVAAAELRRAAGLGFRGAEFSWSAAAEPVFAESWEPLWAAAEEVDLPISGHVVGGRHSLTMSDPRDWTMPAGAATIGFQFDEIIAGLLLSGVLERHPRLRLVMAEAGVSWIPYLLECLDLQYERYAHQLTGYRLRNKPSELFARQMYVTYQVDTAWVGLVGRIAVENVMWASDYPHNDTTFPHSRASIERCLAGLDPADKARVVSKNAAALYRL